MYNMELLVRKQKLFKLDTLPFAGTLEPLVPGYQTLLTIAHEYLDTSCCTCIHGVRPLFDTGLGLV